MSLETSLFDNVKTIGGIGLKTVKTTGGQTFPMKGKGNAKLRFDSGEIKDVTDVLYVPGVTKNLLAVGALSDRGFKFLLMRNEVTVLRDTHAVAKGIRDKKNGLYKMLSNSPLDSEHCVAVNMI